MHAWRAQAGLHGVCPSLTCAWCLWLAPHFLPCICLSLPQVIKFDDMGYAWIGDENGTVRVMRLTEDDQQQVGGSGFVEVA